MSLNYVRKFPLDFFERNNRNWCFVLSIDGLIKQRHIERGCLSINTYLGICYETENECIQFFERECHVLTFFVYKNFTFKCGCVADTKSILLNHKVIESLELEKPLKII